MKKIFIVLSLIVASAYMFQMTRTKASTVETAQEESLTEEKYNVKAEDFRGLWVASVLNIDYPKEPATDAEVLKEEALAILEHAEGLGLNAIFLQVRPTADALYESKYFPVSKYLTGAQGTKPADAFDPLEFWVSEAHKRGMELHAWINPYRITRRTKEEPSHDFASLSSDHPARKNSSWVVMHSDGNLYFDPGIPEVRSLVIDGAMEIIDGYDVDGIHFDDYFYPGKDFDDKSSFEKYGKGFEDIEEWRRENVNILIRELSMAIKERDGEVSFGISPVGIWANHQANPLGSDTRGMQSYYDQYADTRKWVKEGWIDYIAPQIYWNIGFPVADYSKLVDWWQEVVADTGVDLYIGHAAYRTGNTDPKSPWYGTEEIVRQLKLNELSPNVKGSIFFNYTAFSNNQALTEAVAAIYKERDEKNQNKE